MKNLSITVLSIMSPRVMQLSNIALVLTVLNIMSLSIKSLITTALKMMTIYIMTHSITPFNKLTVSISVTLKKFSCASQYYTSC